ncbi:MAG: redoxin domain-containing protein [Bryobacterales bacterium]|nr:redoxin domain-containing protein [Bryobacterales bacterium]
MKSAFAALLLSTTLAHGWEQATLLEDGQPRSISLAGKITAVVFVSSVCPISNEYVDRMIDLWQSYSSRGVQFLFVNSNANETARDVTAHTKAAGLPFPVYRDVQNGLADRLRATLTPEAFLLDRDGRVRYQGALDDARNPARVKRSYLKEGIESVLAGRPVSRESAKATGCTIKREREMR